MKILKMGLFLAIVTALAGGALAAVNHVTAPIIAEKAIASERANLELIFPNTNEFLIVEDFEDDTGLVVGVYEAVGDGMAYKLQVQGFANPVVFMVGINNDGNIGGYQVLDINDTPGYGDRVTLAEFTDNVIGKSTTEGIPVLSGATVTSTAVVSGINAAKAMFNLQHDIDDDGSGAVIDTPPLQFSESVGIFTKQTENIAAEILEEATDGDVTTYLVASRGYAVLEAGYPDAQPNIFEVKIDHVTNKIVSVVMVESHDTPGIGDKVEDEQFLEQFVDLDITDTSIEVDAVAGATITSVSAARAVRAAIGLD
ncbi:MAG: FMN-binding protein [Erysipelothrix sp.]|jgi:Na+-translocating ferredoxin:NAD+ oxidoreductase RnfG subunit|nr:FMN-binding protein [Erysipelothrix sp.]